jgi:hypothetical protein
VPASHEPFDGEHGVLRVGDRLTFGDLSDQTFAILGEGDDRRCGPSAFRIGNDRRLPAFHHGDAGVGRSQIDSYDFGHYDIILSSSFAIHLCGTARLCGIFDS